MSDFDHTDRSRELSRRGEDRNRPCMKFDATGIQAKKEVETARKKIQNIDITTLDRNALKELTVFELAEVVECVVQERKRVWDRLSVVETELKRLAMIADQGVSALANRCTALEELLCGMSDVELRMDRAGKRIETFEKALDSIGDLFKRMAEEVRGIPR